MPKESVILLHGILRTRRNMEPLAKALRGEGYEVLNVDYPSRRYDLAGLVEVIHGQSREFITAAPVVHFVGFSMGGLLARALIHRHRPANLGRVVLLATPNQGSEWADVLQKFRLYRWLFGPAGQQLTTTAPLSDLLGPIDYPCGVIAGHAALNFNPLGHLLLTGPHDGTVTVARTRADNLTAHTTLKSCHTLFPGNKEAQRQTISFLKTGEFA